MNSKLQIEHIVDKLDKCNKLCIMTGAGVSAESGISTFRDPDGFWAKYNPQELASIDGFISNPELVWSWYQFRVGQINISNPNQGHLSLAELELLFDDFTIITQNVDGLHQKAGSKNVVELHGSIVRNKCLDCNKVYVKLISNKKTPPNCSHCNGLIRPDVVWFGEMLATKKLQFAKEKSMNCEIFISIGTSAEVFPAASLPLIAKDNGAYLIEINPNDTPITPYSDIKLAYSSGKVLPLIVEKYKHRV